MHRIWLCEMVIFLLVGDPNVAAAAATAATADAEH